MPSSPPSDRETEHDAALPHALQEWIRSVVGGDIASMERRSGGMSRQSWVLTNQQPPARFAQVFCRRTRPSSPLASTTYDLAHEAVAYQSLAGTGLPMPELYGQSPDGSALLLEYIDAEADFNTVAGTDRGEAVAGHFMSVLAQLHQLHPGQLDLPAQARVESVAEGVRREIDVWDGVRVEHCRRLNPAVSYIATWLRANIPTVEAAPVLVHGDAGPGNFLFTANRVVAVVDWELWHLGDPMEDLAWLSIRGMLQPFGHLHRRIAEYQAAGGATMAPERADYYRILCAWRNCVALGAQLDAGLPDTDLASCLAYDNAFCRLALAGIGHACGYPPAHDAAPARRTPARGNSADDHPHDHPCRPAQPA